MIGPDSQAERGFARGSPDQASCAARRHGLADQIGIDSLNMRRLTEELGWFDGPLRHVTNKEELLDGMVDVVVGEDRPALGSTDWKSSVRQRILSAEAIAAASPLGVRSDRVAGEPLTSVWPASRLDDQDVSGRRLSTDLTHLCAAHDREAVDTAPPRKVFDDSPSLDPASTAMLVSEMEGRYPHIAEMVGIVSRSSVGQEAAAMMSSSSSLLDLFAQWSRKTPPATVGFRQCDACLIGSSLSFASSPFQGLCLYCNPWRPDRQRSGSLLLVHGLCQSLHSG